MLCPWCGEVHRASQRMWGRTRPTADRVAVRCLARIAAQVERSQDWPKPARCVPAPELVRKANPQLAAFDERIRRVRFPKLRYKLDAARWVVARCPGRPAVLAAMQASAAELGGAERLAAYERAIGDIIAEAARTCPVEAYEVALPTRPSAATKERLF